MFLTCIDFTEPSSSRFSPFNFLQYISLKNSKRSYNEQSFSKSKANRVFVGMKSNELSNKEHSKHKKNSLIETEKKLDYFKNKLKALKNENTLNEESIEFYSSKNLKLNDNKNELKSSIEMKNNDNNLDDILDLLNNNYLKPSLIDRKNKEEEEFNISILNQTTQSNVYDIIDDLESSFFFETVKKVN